jgi:hypothetical protein
VATPLGHFARVVHDGHVLRFWFIVDSFVISESTSQAVPDRCCEIEHSGGLIQLVLPRGSADLAKKEVLLPSGHNALHAVIPTLV